MSGATDETGPGVRSNGPTVRPYDHHDFDDFYRSEYARVVRISFVICGQLVLAEEVAQEAFIAAHRNWQRLTTYDRPDLWVRRVTINGTLSAMRRRSAERRAVARLDAAHLETFEPVLPEPDQRLWSEVGRLPQKQRQVFVLVTLEDRPFSQVARIVGCTENTARTHYRRARLALAAVLDVEEAAHEPR